MVFLLPVDKKKLFLNHFVSIVLVAVSIFFPVFLCLFPLLLLKAEVTQLGTSPDWSRLDAYQEKISPSSFRHALDTVYCPREEWWQPWLSVKATEVRIRKESGKEEWYTLRFREESNHSGLPAPLNLSTLAGRIIAIDPGHIGGKWAEMERRHFQLGDQAPVREGDLTLQVAFHLAGKLRELGVSPVLVRESLEPVTPRRAADFLSLAGEWAAGVFGQETADFPDYKKRLQERAELLFYRVDEIHARARLINETIRPDLVVCLHLNAAPWADQEKRELVERNDYHVLVNGAYMGGELAYDDQRFEMLLRLLSGWHHTEQWVAEKVAASFARHTPMPAFVYRGPNAIKVGEVEGVWARNLLANRIYRCPVIFLEPYVANSKPTYSHIQLGHYDGVRNVEGIPRKALVEEYTKCVVQGILEAYSQEVE